MRARYGANDCGTNIDGIRKHETFNVIRLRRTHSGESTAWEALKLYAEAEEGRKKSRPRESWRNDENYETDIGTLQTGDWEDNRNV